MTRYKYKREHFATQEEDDRFLEKHAAAVKRWYHKESPERKERRLLRQRLYSRWYNSTDFKESFRDYLISVGIDDINTEPISRLRHFAKKLNKGKAKLDG